MFSVINTLIMFVGTLIAACIGAMLAPSFSQFLNVRKSKRDETLRYLEETYLLAKKVNEYCRQAPSHICFLVAAQEGKISITSIPKLPDEPFSRMDVLLDYHLKAPPDLIEKIKSLGSAIIMSMYPIAEAINNPKNQVALHGKAITQCLDVAKSAPAISVELISWIKAEKLKIESSTWS